MMEVNRLEAEDPGPAVRGERERAIEQRSLKWLARCEVRGVIEMSGAEGGSKSREPLVRKTNGGKQIARRR